MKNLFLHAKYIAKEEKSEKITMKHIIIAIENMDLGGGDLEKDILKYLEEYEENNSFGSLF